MIQSIPVVKCKFLGETQKTQVLPLNLVESAEPYSSTEVLAKVKTSLFVVDKTDWNLWLSLSATKRP